MHGPRYPLVGYALMLRRQEPGAAQATSVWLWRKDSNLNLSVNSRAHRPAMLRQNKTGAEGESRTLNNLGLSQTPLPIGLPQRILHTKPFGVTYGV